MNYEELLDTLSNQLRAAAQEAANKQAKMTQTSTPKEDTTSILLNKIELEIQRQGG